MRSLTFWLLSTVLFVAISPVLAQPYTLDKSIKPIELNLKEDTRKGHEGEKGIVFVNRVTDSVMYHYVTGHSMFQFVDVLVTSIDGSPLRVSLNQDQWNDTNNEKRTSSSSDDTANFKLRAEGSFGIKIESDDPTNSLYSIAVVASPVTKAYLDSPFRKIKENEIAGDGDTDARASDGASDDGDSNLFLYIALGVALLVIGVLAGKLMGKKGRNSTTVLLLLILSPLSGFAQSGGGTYLTMEEFEQYKLGVESDHEHLLRKLEILEKERAAVDKSFKDINANIAKIRSLWDQAKSLYNQYSGLSNCIDARPPQGSPTIPSICAEIVLDERGEPIEEQDGDCASCFLEARKKFNDMRYQFERLATIYKCTKKFSDAAIAFGDNVSGVHGVSGMAWQAERVKIERSVVELQQAYNNKYAEMLQGLADAMMELNVCEAKFGVEDWYDRFGYMYFEFMKEKYARKD
ncbi:MAG: hypothetical protein MK211_12790 [Flavobacteriales bacterium]|jgi:hypothetical protein|nr:hypothetical protein [Flavobacteriales bacterium]